MPKKFLIILVFPVLLILQCAQQGSPSGGPADQTPPVAEQFFPGQQSVNVPLCPVLSLKWSEWINRASFEKGFLLNPPNAGNPHFRWNGKRVEITMDSCLSPNTTYSISIASNVKDLHNVSMGKPVSWSFSTGSTLARGSIDGQIIGPARNPLICAYRVSGSDSGLALEKRKADYITTADTTGRFRFSFLNQGLYRVIAFEDENGDRMPQIPQERVAIASRDCPAQPDSGVQALVLSLSRMDTTGFSIVSAQGINPYEIRIRFNRLLDPLGGSRKENVRLFSADSLKDSLAVVGIGLAETDSELVIQTVPQKAPRYRVRLRGITDVSGVKLRQDSIILASVLSADTLSPRISRTNPPQGAILAHDSLELVFSKPVIVYPARIRLTDSAGQSLPARIIAKGYSRVVARSDSMIPGRTYRLKFEPYAVADFSRNMLRDTLARSFAISGEEDLTKSITGRLVSANPSPSVVIWTHLETQRRFQYRFDSDSMRIEGLPSGRYVVSAFKDRDGDGRHHPGSLKPFSFSEPQIAYPDTLTLRPRWEFEGLTLSFEE